MLKQVLAIAVVGVLALLIGGAPPDAGAVLQSGSGSYRINPGTINVNAGDEFQFDIVQSSDVVTTGAETTLHFDPAFMQVVSVSWLGDYADGTLLIGTGQEPVAAIDESNVTGVLQRITSFFNPGSGTMPPGENPFVTITMVATAAGSAPLALAEGCISTADEQGNIQSCSLGELRAVSEMLDENYEQIPVTTVTGATVAIGSAAPGSTPVTVSTPGPGGTPAGGSPTPEAESTVLGEAAAPLTVAVRVEPDSLTVEKGEEFEVTLTQEIAVPATFAEVEVKFKHDLVQLSAVEPGEEWAEADGASDADLEEAIAEANETGTLTTSFNYTGDQTAADGESPLLTMNMRADDGQDGTSAIELARAEFVDADGNALELTSENGEIIVGSGEGGGGFPILIVLLVVLVVAAIAGGAGWWYMRRRRAWA